MVGRNIADSAYDRLINAIILQAVADYKRALKYYTNPKNEEQRLAAKRSLAELDEFFHSEWYELLTEVSGSYIMRKIKEDIK